MGKLGALCATGAMVLGSVVPTAVQATVVNWHQTAELVGADTASGDGFGSSVALSGNTVVVGARYGAEGLGRAYMFTKTTSGWHQTAELVASDAVSGRGFGSSVALSGSMVVVGARDRGRAYVFSKTASGWQQTAEFLSSRTDVLGQSVAISGSTIMIGAYLNAIQTGRVDVFERTAVGWHQTAELAGSDSEFGESSISLVADPHPVAISGTTIVVGDSGRFDDAGRAYVFAKTSSGWRQTAELVGADTAANDSFGNSVAISGSTVLVGADGHANGAGRAYVFTKTASG